MQIAALILCAFIVACGTSTESREITAVDLGLNSDMSVATDGAPQLDALRPSDMHTADAMVSSDMLIVDVTLPDAVVADIALPDDAGTYL